MLKAPTQIPIDKPTIPKPRITPKIQVSNCIHRPMAIAFWPCAMAPIPFKKDGNAIKYILTDSPTKKIIQAMTNLYSKIGFMKFPKKEHKEKVKEVLMEAINVDEDMIKLEANLKDDLGIDSLAAVELSLELETEFDVRIEDEELAKLVTVADIVSLLESKA